MFCRLLMLSLWTSLKICLFGIELSPLFTEIFIFICTFHIYIFRSTNLFVAFCLCLCVCVSVCLCLSVYLCLFLCPSLSVCLSVSLSLSLSFSLSRYVSLPLSSLSLSLSLSSLLRFKPFFTEHSVDCLFYVSISD